MVAGVGAAETELHLDVDLVHRKSLARVRTVHNNNLPCALLTGRCTLLPEFSDIRDSQEFAEYTLDAHFKSPTHTCATKYCPNVLVYLSLLP